MFEIDLKSLDETIFSRYIIKGDFRITGSKNILQQTFQNF